MRHRVVISLGLLLCLCLLGDAAAILALHQSTHQLGALVESHRIQAIREHLLAASVRVESDLLAELSGHSRPIAMRLENERRLDESLHSCSACHHEPDIAAQLSSLHDIHETFQQQAKVLYALEDRTASQRLERRTIETGEQLVHEATETADRASAHLMTRSTHAAAGVGSASRVLLWTLGVALAFGILVAFHLERSLTHPVRALLGGIRRIHQGDVNHRLSVQGDKEFRVLADAFNQAYDDIRRAHESILHAEKLAAVGKLAAGVAHEVLNPLASISSIVQLMRGRNTSKEQEEQISLILKETARISQVLRDLQVFSRPLPTEKPVFVKLDELIEYATTLVGYDPRARKVAITREHDPDVGPIRADTDRLLLVFTNIMINALDAISAGGRDEGVLSISTRAIGDRVEVTFQDNGLGMTDDQIMQAFEPFFTTKEAGAGTGLGLWICHQVAQGLGGTIRIESEVGRQTAVTFSVPREPELAAEEHALASTV